MKGLEIKKVVVLVFVLSVLIASFNFAFAGTNVINSADETQEAQTPEVSTELITEEVEVPMGGDAVIPAEEESTEEATIEDEDVALDSGAESSTFKAIIILFIIVAAMFLASAVIINNNQKTKMR